MRKSLRVCIPLFVGVALLAALFASTGNNVQARPQYNKAFLATYPDLADAAKEAKCNVCHEGKSKKMRNVYGKAMSKILGDEKNVKDDAAIKKLFDDAAKEKSSVDGKTFGDLIGEGKLPASDS